MQPKFKKGDAIQDAINEEKGMIAAMWWGTSVAKPAYRIDWFAHPIRRNLHTLKDYRDGGSLKPCKGTEDTTMCDQCEYRFKCWTSRRK